MAAGGSGRQRAAGRIRSDAIVAVLLALASGACVDRAIGPEQVVDRPAGYRAIPTSLGRVLALADVRSSDEEWAELARTQPGFAGFTIDSAGRAAIAIKRGSDAGAVRAAASQYLADRTADPERRRLIDSLGMREVERDFDELFQASERARIVFTQPGVTMMDVDEARNLVVVGVESPSFVVPMEQRLARLGLSDGVVIVEVSPPVQVAATVQDLIRPVLAGTQIVNSSGQMCTIGPSVLPRFSGVVDSTFRYVLTNSHCSPQFGVVDGVTFGQPLAVNPIGVDVFDPPLFTNVESAQCDPGRLCRWSDATLIRLNTGTTHNFGRIARTRSTTDLTLKSNYVILGESQYYFVGLETLYKTGRSTGTSFGQSFQSCVRVRQFESGVDTGRDLLCQDQANVASQGGDSGSPVFSSLNTQTTNVTLHGMLWGTGWTVFPTGGVVRMTFSRINYIYAELNGYFSGGFLTAVP